MKITRRQLRRIIKEEIKRAQDIQEIVDDPMYRDKHKHVQDALRIACSSATPLGMGGGACNSAYENNEDFRVLVNKIVLDSESSAREAIDDAMDQLLAWFKL